jgi:hypothetical protein
LDSFGGALVAYAAEVPSLFLYSSIESSTMIGERMPT